MLNVIPAPKSHSFAEGSFNITEKITIKSNNDPKITAIAEMFAKQIQQLTGLTIEIAEVGEIEFYLNDDQTLGNEGYELSVTPDGLALRAHQLAGLFYGTQTLRQLISTHQNGTISLPALSITDSPRFTWRGAMLDVARHFFSVDDVKRYIDLISHYKINRLHLHLTDDQGWRIEIKSWSKLTEIGAQTQVNGGGGGFYTQEQYKEIIDYANSRYIMIIPEIDTPGHTNAALASYPELNVSEEAPEPYEGIEVGFSSLSINIQITYQFLDDVIRELAAITPGPYIHIGGDEAKSTPKEDYKLFIKRIQEIVYSHNKTPIGWAEIGEAGLDSRTIAQHWDKKAYLGAKEQGCKIILSPANKTYLDIKYDANSPLGLDWVGLVSVKDSYDWEPGSYMEMLEESDILGLEFPIWTETLLTMKDIEFMAFPRLPGLAELAWSPANKGWDKYKTRLAKHGKHMDALDINYFKSPDVDWE